MFKVYRAYFAVALALGCRKHVYRVSNRWGGNSAKVGKDRYNAAAEATRMLIDDGYHSCPSCHWATSSEDEHVNVVESYCHNEEFQSLRRRRREGGVLQPKEVARLARLSRARRRYGQPFSLQWFAHRLIR